MMDIQSAQDLARALVEAKRALEQAQSDLVKAAHAAAEKDKAYRLARSFAFAKSRESTVAGREYEVDAKVADERYEAQLSEALKVAALEHVRSCRGWMSAVQTLSNAWREEVALARVGGGVE